MAHYHRLSLEEREELSRMLASGYSLRATGRALNRAPSTLGRELARHREYVLIAGIGLASFAVVFGLLRILPRQLPTASHLERFDRAVWQDPRSAEYVQGDITSREKMLEDVVKTVLPGSTRTDLEETLGASLEGTRGQRGQA